MKLLSTKHFPESVWSGGITKELYIHPDGSIYSDQWFDYRLSMAWVNLPETTFTPLPGYQRYICLLEGCIDLTHADGKEKRLCPGEVYHFDGESKTTSRSEGKVQDFNLIYNPGQTEAMMNVCILGEDETQYVQALGHTYVYLHAGKMQAGEKVMNDQDMLILEPGEEIEIKALKPGQLVIATVADKK